MISNTMQVKIDTKKIVLSSAGHCFKTESFTKKTRYVSNIDVLLSKIAGTIIFHYSDIASDSKPVYTIETNDKAFKFAFVLGKYYAGLDKFDIVFCDYIENIDVQLNMRVDEYVQTKSEILATIKKEDIATKDGDFKKLYMLSIACGVNLPRLTLEQRIMVESVDKNVLVQGVAGSGKTNICIEKIIFTACRNYSGKTLYTTFSRGLLTDTKLKVESIKSDLIAILEASQNGNLVFLDNDHKKALENRLGIYFNVDDDDKIFDKIKRIIDYLENKVDYYLLEDLYREKADKEAVFVGQDYFINEYTKSYQNHQVSKAFEKLNKYSKEIIYKEIFGMIFGYSVEDGDIISQKDYVNKRATSFATNEAEAIYLIGLDYYKHLKERGLKDNNIASRELLEIAHDFEYSLSIIDEVQDYTQINLNLFKKLSLKVFAVGDALQMINPAYFNFGYLKNLLYDEGLTDIATLKFNYRNTAKIEKIISALTKVNREEFGTHNFIVEGESVDSGLDTTAIYLKAKDFATRVASSGYDNFTFVVSDSKEKESLKKIIKNQEVLTVSEIKGLERPTVVAYNILSANIDKWQALARQKVNHKSADENSVYRYYYNLFYVALSRAKQNILVVENEHVSRFEEFFKQNFEVLDTSNTIKKLNNIVSKVEFTQDDAKTQAYEFIKLEQFENARFMANKILDDSIRIAINREIEIAEKYIHFGKYRDAGIKFWEYGMVEEAKKMFTLSGDTMLISLVDMCNKSQTKDLNIDIVDYYDDVKDNTVARDFILETINKDFEGLKKSFKEIKDTLKRSGK